MSELAKKPFRFGAEYGFGDTPQPQGQPGFYSVPLPVARQLPQDRPVSFGELTKAYFDIHTLSGSVVEWGTAKAAILAQDSDPGYNPYEDPQLETFTDEEKDSVFYRSRSAGETAIIIERLRREREARRIIETEGLTMRSVGAAVLSNIPDIAAVIVSGGGAAVARGGLTVAQIGARGAAVAAGATAVEEGVLQATQYERTLTESAVNVAGATVFGGLVAAATPAVRKVFGAHQETLIAGMADDAAGILGKKGEFDDQALQIVMNPATGAITEAPYKSVKSATGGPIGWIRKRVSPNGRVDTYPEPVAREMRKYLSTDAISEANMAGEAIVSAEARLYDWDYLTKGAVKSVSDSYKAYLKRERATVAERIKVGLGMPPSRRIMSETEHAAYISRIAQDGADDLIPERFGYTPHPDDLAAGRKVRELLDRYLAEGQKAGVFGADMQPGQYFTHWWKVREIMDRQADFRNDLIADLPAMLRKQDVTLSPAEIGELASDIIESMTVLKGSLPDGVRVNVGPLKGRTLNFDNQANVVRKWTVQDPYEVLERYKFGVGGRIELARLASETPELSLLKRRQDNIRLKAGITSEADLSGIVQEQEILVRKLFEQYSGVASEGLDVSSKDAVISMKQAFRDIFDVKKDVARSETAAFREGVAAQASWARQLSRQEKDAAIAAVEREYAAKVSATRAQSRETLAAIGTASESEKAAIKNGLDETLARLERAKETQIAEINLGQRGQINMERLKVARELSETRQQVADLVEAQREMSRYIGALSYMKKEVSKRLSDDIHEMEKAFSFGPLSSATNREAAIAEARANMNDILSSFDSDIGISRIVEQSFRAAKDQAPNISAMTTRIRVLNRMLREAEKGAITDPHLIAARAESLIAAAEGSSMARAAAAESLTALKNMTTRLRASVRAASATARSEAAASRAAARAAAGETAEAAQEAIAADVAGMRGAINRFLADSIADITDEYRQFSSNLGNAIKLKTQAERLQRLDHAITMARADAARRAISGEQSKDTIRAYYRTARDGAGSNAEKAALTAQENTALSDVDSMVALLTGGFGDPKDTSGISRLVPAAMKWNYATKMGRVVIAQFNDVGTLPLRYGFGPTIRGFRDAGKYLKDPAWQTAREELRLFADALDTVTATRMMSLADMDNAYLYRTGLDHLTDRLARGTGIVSGFNWWSENFKMMSGQLASGQIFRAATGKPDQFTRGLMAASGLDDAALKELARRPWLERGSSAIPDFGRWPDDDITLAFGRAVRTLVKATTNEPTIGMKPFWTRTTFGKMASQFKGFYFGFFEHTLNFMEQKLVLGTPAEKAGVAGSTAAFMALGALSYWTREKSYGRDPDIDSVDFWFNSMDYSGLPILFTEPNNLLEKLSGGKVGLRPWLGIEPGGRYREIDPVGALAGPTAQLGRDIGGAATAIPVTTFGAIGGSILGGGRGALAGAAAGAVVDITRGEAPSADAVKRFIKITPWNNAVLFSGLYDAADLAGEIATGSEFLPNEPRKEIPEMIGRSRKRRKGGSL